MITQNNNHYWNKLTLLDTTLKPWGSFAVTYESGICKTKFIKVSPGGRSSYHYHEKREEKWVIIRGVLTVIVNDIKFKRKPGETVIIPKKVKHRFGNFTAEEVEVMEIQTGTYFAEDDIIRIEDDYNRK